MCVCIPAAQSQFSFSWFTSDADVLTSSSPRFSSCLRVETFFPIPQLSWTYKVSNPPIELRRWNGFRSLAFQDVLKSHLSAFLSISTLTFVSSEACCWGRIDGSVQQDRDEWKIFTASIDQPRSANSCDGSEGPWRAGFLLYWAWDETGREDGGRRDRGVMWHGK